MAQLVHMVYIRDYSSHNSYVRGKLNIHKQNQTRQALKGRQTKDEMSNKRNSEP